MVLPIVKSITGSTIAEMIVTNSRVSTAVKIEVSELIQASRMFFVSFILLNFKFVIWVR